MLLAVETATQTGSVALVNDDGLVAREALSGQRDHGASLAGVIDRLVGDRFDELEAYALSIGPGSFTGLRIGISLIKGIAAVYARPAISIPTLEALAQGVADRMPDAQRFLPILDAKRKEVFCALYERRGDGVTPSDRLREGVYQAVDVPDLVGSTEGLVAAGDGVEVDFRSTPQWRRSSTDLWIPDAAVVGRLAWGRFRAGEGTDPMALEPVYHQVSAAEANLGIKLTTA